MTATLGKIFHIGPDWTGAEGLARIFQQNGHQVRCHDKGALAADILTAVARDRKPLTAHGDVTLFAGLYRTQPDWRPPLEAWRAFAHLDRHFPNARFILTTRDIDGWILDRLTRDNGGAARCYAHHNDLPEGALPDLWRRDWQDHLDAVAAYFGDDPRFIRVDIDRESPAAFCQRLDGLLSLPRRPQSDDWLPADKGSLDQRLAAALDHPHPAPPADDPDFVRDVADYCLGGLTGGTGPVEGVSPFYCHWNGADQVTDRNGAALAMTVATPPGGNRPVAMQPDDADFKKARAEGVINDILRLGRADPVRIDMQDARGIGAPGKPPLAAPVLCYNRVAGARNVVLWPLPGQHEIAAPGQPCAESPDRIPFADKQDRLVWRGNISGTSIGRPGAPPRPSHQLLEKLRGAGDDAALQQQAFQHLCDVPRMAFLRRFIDHPDFDIGMVLAWRFRDMAKHPLLAPYARPRVGGDYFHRFRYQLTLAGYDHGSNFIGAINSQSVLLKEEDGWEVYYLGRFKPWIHYIPVELYCADIQEKLAWARLNPDRCQAMSQAARAEVRRLANPLARRQILERILDGLAKAAAKGE